MSVPIPSCEPSQFVAGDSLVWNRSLARYAPADGWALHYRFVGPFELTSDPVVAVVDGYFQVTLAAAATAAEGFVAGTYRLIGWVDGVNSERHTIFDGHVEILANLATADWESLQGHEERMIAACEAALEDRLSADVARYGREGTFVDKLDIGEIRRTLGIYQAKKWRKDNPGISFPQHAIAFSAPGRRPNSAEALGWPGLDQ